MNYLEDIAERVRAGVPDDLVPDDADALFLMYAVLARAKGTATTREDVHDAWTAWMLTRGEQHSSMRPYSELPADTRGEDEPFVEAIRSAVEQS